VLSRAFRDPAASDAVRYHVSPGHRQEYRSARRAAQPCIRRAAVLM